jgi:hypothetical protein
MATPQELATLLAPGELTYGLKAGFFIYPHKHGICSFNLLQHSGEGGEFDVIAPRHGLNSSGLQFTASAMVATSTIRTTTSNIAHTTFIFIILTT